MNPFFRMILVIVVCIVPLPAAADNVLVLGDGTSEAEVTPVLEAAGHTVDCSCTYFNWDGATPSLDGFDAVVFLDGDNYGQGLDAAAVAALQAFVASGHGLVVTEWTAWDACMNNLAGEIADLLPVELLNCDSWGRVDRNWIVMDADHPLASGVPASWTDGGGWSRVDAKTGATVVVAHDGSIPLTTYWKPGAGVVVHVNHAMLDVATASIADETKQVVLNAVEYASAVLFDDGFEMGTIGAWSGSTE